MTRALQNLVLAAPLLLKLLGPASADPAVSRVVMGRMLALVVAGEQCGLMVRDGLRQDLAAEGERLQLLAELNEAEAERMAVELAQRPNQIGCAQLAARLDGLAREMVEEARRIR